MRRRPWRSTPMASWSLRGQLAPLCSRSHHSGNTRADKFRPLDALVRDARVLLHRRRAGKIAKLPPAVRQQINTMLQDGVLYATIISRLGEAGRGINIHNLSRWRRADYQDWLDQQAWREALPSNENASPQTKDLTLLLHNLDSQPLGSRESLRKSAYVRHVNLICKHMGRMAAPTTSNASTGQSPRLRPRLSPSPGPGHADPSSPVKPPKAEFNQLADKISPSAAGRSAPDSEHPKTHQSIAPSVQ